MIKFLVMTSSRDSYRSWLNESGVAPNECKLVMEARDFMGYRNIGLLRVGQWWLLTGATIDAADQYDRLAWR